MSENTHIDKIFKDGLGEMNFSNGDAMWQKMETELDKDGKKRRPIVFFVFVACLLTAGLFTVNHFNKPAIVVAENKAASLSTTSVEAAQANKNATEEKDVASLNSTLNSTVNNSGNTALPAAVKQTTVALHTDKNVILNRTKHADFNTGNASQAVVDATTDEIAPAEKDFVNNDFQLGKMIADVDMIAAIHPKQTSTIAAPSLSNKITPSQPVAPKKEIAQPNKIMIEAVGGGDLLRLNRKAGYYAGVRVSRHLKTGSVLSVGVNYASHTVLDKYRVATKPAEQRSSDARINNISTVRMPVYLQSQMGKSKFAMMIGLVPTYITQAEVYNVPNSYVGDPNPYRKFTLEDIHRFNLLFGAGLRYSATKWIAVELSGNYGLTGMVKDGYKNLSRVNDNFKSIQLGVALRLK